MGFQLNMDELLKNDTKVIKEVEELSNEDIVSRGFDEEGINYQTLGLADI